MTIHLPEVADPRVTVIMVTYGARDWCERSIRALVAVTPPVYELVVVDNASPDGTGAWLEEHLAGATVLRNRMNLGFGPASNQGALWARGRHLCFLNSDTLVEHGWLDPLVETVEGLAGTGAAVPCLLDLDGRVQEAGAVIGRDGATESVGRGADPADSGLRFRRAVEYGSAACLLLPRATFAALGGFDAGFGRGYCEDVDLCLALAEHGLATVYEPRSRVRHAGGGSTTPEQAIGGLWSANNARLVRRWASVVRDRASLPGPLAAAAARRAAMDLPAPDRVLLVPGSASLGTGSRVHRIARRLATWTPAVRVTLAAVTQDEAPAGVEPLLQAGVEVVWGEDLATWLDERRFSYSVALLTDPSAATSLVRLLERSQPQASVVLDVAGGGDGGFPAEAWAAANAVWAASAAGLDPVAIGGLAAHVVPDDALSGQRPSPELDAAFAALGLTRPGLLPQPVLGSRLRP